jgi:hypothetical protein
LGDEGWGAFRILRQDQCLAGWLRRIRAKFKRGWLHTLSEPRWQLPPYKCIIVHQFGLNVFFPETLKQ